MSLSLVFMGTPDFAVPVFSALLDAGHRVLAAYSQPPRPAGRGHHLKPSPVQRFAEERGIPVLTPKSLKPAEAQAEFGSFGADAAVVAAYGLILPKAVLAAPRLGCLNVHGSLLPRWRGAAPIQRAILAGDKETGITIMQMDEGLDTGAMLAQAVLPIGPQTTGQSLHDALAELGARLMVETLADIEAGRARAIPQPADGVTYAAKIGREEGAIDWRQDADALDRMIRAFTPWPGAWFEKDGERIKLLAARPVAGQGAPGQVLDGRPVVACGRGALQLVRLQRAGRAPMPASDFLRGFELAPGTKLPCPATS